MGSSTESANCTNVAVLGEFKGLVGIGDYEDEDYKPPTELKGWVYKQRSESPYRGKVLYPNALKGPNGEWVYFVNSSQYAAGGAFWFVVFGPQREHVQAFLTAIKRGKTPIAAKAIVQQTL
jgi:hypothetical protein